MSLLEKREYYRPFHYNEAYSFWETQQTSFWIHLEISMDQDIYDWKFNLSDSERSIIGNILKSFVQSEVLIGDYWRKLAAIFQHPEIGMMCAAFSAMESNHIAAYAYLNDTLGLQDFKEFLTDEIAMERLSRLSEPPEVFEYSWISLYGQEAHNEWRKQMATSLAVFSAFGEGVALFSAFAILLSFAQRGLMRGLGEIIEMSIRDECTIEGTEVLTVRGWIKIEDLLVSDLVANWHENREITFTPYVKTADFISDTSYIFEHENMHQHVSPNHRIVYKTYRDNLKVVKAKDAKFNNMNTFDHGGLLQGEVLLLTTQERLQIAIQADAHLRTRSTVSDTISFEFSKQRKIDRLKEILDTLNIPYNETIKNDGKTKVQFLTKIAEYTKDFSRFNLNNKSSVWCNEFINEALQWDGCLRKDGYGGTYCSTNKTCIDFIQAVVACAGKKAKLSISEDNRKDSYKTYYRLNILNSSNSRGSGVNKTLITEPKRFIGISVPSTFIIIRSNNKVSVTGNCLHSKGGIWLFNTFMSENKDLHDIKKRIYEAGRITVQIEDKFIDSVFLGSSLPNCSSDNLKEFIRQRMNNQLREIHLKPEYKIDKAKVKTLSWFNVASAGDQHGDFFASRVTQYAKSDGWSTMWSEL